MGARGTAIGIFDPVRIPPPTPSKGDGNGKEEAGRALTSLGPEEDGKAGSVRIAAKGEKFHEKQALKI